MQIEPDQTASDQGFHCLHIVWPFPQGMPKSYSLTYLTLKFASSNINTVWSESSLGAHVGNAVPRLIVQFLAYKFGQSDQSLRCLLAETSDDWLSKERAQIAHVGSWTFMIVYHDFNQTPSPIFVILCVLCFQRQPFLTFILHFNRTNCIKKQDTN